MSHTYALIGSGKHEVKLGPLTFIHDERFANFDDVLVCTTDACPAQVSLMCGEPKVGILTEILSEQVEVV